MNIVEITYDFNSRAVSLGLPMIGEDDWDDSDDRLAKLPYSPVEGGAVHTVEYRDGAGWRLLGPTGRTLEDSDSVDDILARLAEIMEDMA